MQRIAAALLATFLLVLCATPMAQSKSGYTPVDQSNFGELQWRSIGPFRGGRALAVTGVPGEPEHFYFGAVDGGVWESHNAGRTWTPIFDSESIGSIGAIAVAPSAARTLYVGSGEADMRSDIAYGNGMYKSVDGGKTWTHIGLNDTRQIGAIVVDPHDANIVYVAALGHAYGPNAERGVYKSTDGGATWAKVLFKNDDTGAIDIAMDPSNSSVLYASLWQTRRPAWNAYPPSNGPGGGLYKSIDAGKTWMQLTNGLPAKVGHIGITISAADPQCVYLQVDSDRAQGGVYRSDDAGATFTHTAGGADQARIWERGWYFGGITVDPKNPDIVYVMDTATYRSTDGGKTFTAIKGAPGGDDYHTLWIDPQDSNRMILGSDQGVIVSVDDAATWSSWYNQPTAQFYHVTTDNAFPYNVYGAQQDSGAAMTPSSTKYATLSQQDFHPIDSGGENGEIASDPNHPGTIFGGSDTVTAENIATGWELNIDPGTAFPDQDWRHTWTLPLVISPANSHALYTARQRVFRSTDGGNHWTIVSPDLTRSKTRGVVYALTPSPHDATTLWAGTDDGYVWITHDGGAHWANITPSALTPWSKIGNIEVSARDANTAYISVDRHRIEDYAPHIYRTRDGGAHWTEIVHGIPDGSFVNVVREDPKQAGLLYAGTEMGVDVSFDDGANWHSLQRNLPTTSVRDIDVRGDDLVIATHGRGFYIMDDIAPLRARNDSFVGEDAYLFQPIEAVRVRPGNEEGTPLPLDEPQAQNRTPGVYIDYLLRDVARTPMSIKMLNASGTVMRSWSSADKPDVTDPTSVDIAPIWLTTPALPSATAGLHRFIWNFGAKSEDGPLVAPGIYSVVLSVNGHSYEREFRIVRDPRIAASDADLRAQYALATAIVARKDAISAARKKATALKIADPLIVGTKPVDDPDESSPPIVDFVSLRFLANAYANLESQVESADAGPTTDMRAAFAKLGAIYDATMARFASLATTPRM